MNMFFFILGVLFALATLGSLGVGLIAMAKGGDFNDRYGNKLMRARVMLQAAAIACFALAFLAA